MRVLTTDTFCGAYLIAGGSARLVEVLVDRTGARESGTFVLEGADLVKHQETYSRGQAMANVKALRDAVTMLRTELARALRRRAA